MYKNLTFVLIILLCSCKPQKAQLKFLNDTYDFGKIKTDSIYYGYTIIKNTGNDTLKIKSVGADCSCTNVFTTKRNILPEDTCLLTFSYKTYNKIGKQENYVNIITNTDSVVYLLQINSFVQ